MARIRRGYPCGNASRVPFRLSQSQPLARSLRPYRDCVACLPGCARRRRPGRPLDRLRHCAVVALVRGHRGLRRHHLSGGARVRPRRVADSDLVPAGVLGHCRGARGRRMGDKRYRGAGPVGRSGADRHADRIHRHAARLRGRRHAGHRHRCRAPGAGAHGRRRSDLGLGCRSRQGVHECGNRIHTRRQARRTKRRRVAQDCRLRTPDGHSLWFTMRARPVVGSDGEVIRLVGTLTDVSETKIAEERLLHDAVHDNLTGLPNRQLFVDRLDVVLALAKSNPDLRPTVMVMDLDHFKQVNDSVGMAVGDSILLTLARRLSRLLKPQDTLARLSGDQFGVILVSEKDPNRVIAFAEACCKAIRAAITFNERETSLIDPLRVAMLDAQPDAADELIKNAELAMYGAKRLRGDRLEVFKPAMRARKTDRLNLESELRRALSRDEIVLLYRPIVRLENRTVAGFEALARWDHPKMGRLSPFEFVAMVEEIGLIADLGRFAIERTARQLAMWQRAARSRVPLFASVSLSSRQLLKNDVVESLRAVLGRGGLARRTLKLELTESAVMENSEQAAQVLKRLRDFGAGLRSE